MAILERKRADGITMYLIDFRDQQHGVVETSAGESWLTEDGGKTWKRK